MDNHNHGIVSAGCRHKSNRSNGEGSALRILLFNNIFLIIFFLLPGCSPKIVERVVYQHDTTTVHHRDSIFTKDSIYIREWMKGDTVYIEKYKDRYFYKDRWRDSISIKEVHDTTLVEKKVEKPLSPMQKAKIGAFWWLLGALAAALVWMFRKPILAFIKTLI